MIRRPFHRVAFVAGLAGLLGAAPPALPNATTAIPSDDATALVRRYVGALAAGKYDDAFRLLVAGERKYHRDAAGFGGVFRADHYAIKSWKIVQMRSAAAGRVYLVQESIGYRDLGAQVDKQITAVVPVGTIKEAGRWAIKDPGKPERAYASSAEQSANGVRASVRKVSVWPDRIEVVLTFSNTGDGPVTVLAYGKTVLKDDAGDDYPIIALKDWSITDRRLFEGLRLAAGREYTGALSFGRPRDTGISPKRFDLTVAPVLRDGGDAPFALSVAIPTTDG